MPTLNEVLSQADPSLVTAQEHLDWLNTTTEIPGDSTAYTWSGISAALIARGANPSSVLQLASEINTLPGGPILNACLLSGGFNFANENNRNLILSLEVSEPQWAKDLLDAMLAIGAPQTVAKWHDFGLTEQPTIEEIQKIILTNKMQQIFGDLQVGIQNGSLTTVAEVKASADVMFDAAISTLGG